MPFNFAQAKKTMRQAVQDTLGVIAYYKADSESDHIEIRARWHTKLVKQGIVNGEGAQILENADQVVFDVAELLEKEIKLDRGAIIIFPDYQDLAVILDSKVPHDGPVEEIWLASVEEE